jgi:hypothetical protein
MPANNRIYYASQAVLLQGQNSDGTSVSTGWSAPQGLQSVGMTTNFNLEQVFQLGQLELYDNLENVPEIEVTLNKVIDGTPPLYLMCMAGTGTNGSVAGANGKDMAEIVNNRVNFRLGIYSDSVTAATGNATHFVECSGMYLSRFSYTLPVEGNATEEITLVGNNKVWSTGQLSAFTMNEFSPTGTNPTKYSKAPSVVKRYNVNIAGSTLPTGVAGIPVPSGRSVNRPYVQNITISSDLGREAIYELGRMAPYFRYVNFPVEVTSEFSVTASDGDYVNADDFAAKTGCGQTYTNLLDKTIIIDLCGSGTNDFLRLDLGGKNKLTSVNYSGGDTGGGNATISYSFQTFNKFKMTASGTYQESKWIDNTADSDNYF